MRHRYWGPFAEICAATDIDVEEVGSYGEVFAPLADSMMADDSDFGTYAELARRQQGPVLELGCGSGRMLLRLAELGHEAVGLDLSENMLRVLARRLRALPPEVRSRVELVCGDATRFELGREFPLVILPYCSVILFASRRERLALFRAVAKHLTPGGLFAFDYPSFHWDASGSWDGSVITSRVLVGESEGILRLGVKVYHGSKCLLSNSYLELPRPDGTTGHYLESKRMAIIDPAELERTLAEAGLTVVEHKRTLMQGGVAERNLLCCTHKPDGSHPLWHPYRPRGPRQDDLLTLVEGKGCRVRDERGKEYIDASGGLWSTQCGLGRPEIIEAVTRQLARLSYGTLFLGRSNEAAAALARELVSLAPAPLPWVYLTGSGSEAVELGIKLARAHQALRGHPERSEIVYLDQSYHGTFFGSMSVSGLVEEREMFAPLLPSVSSIPAPDPERCPPGVTYVDFAVECARALEERISRSEGGVAAFLLEPVLGSAGVIVPPAEYFDLIQKICRRHGVLLLLDEVATGFGRTGRWFAAEHFGLRPDVLLLAKGINSGYLPLGAVLFTAAVGQTLMHGGVGVGHGSSHNGNPACAAAALATIRLMREEGLVKRAAESGRYFRGRLEELSRYSSVRDVRSLGLMLSVSFRGEDGRPAAPETVATLYTALKNCGVLAYPGPSSLVFMPALTITREEIDIVAETLHGVVAAVSGGSCAS